MIVVKLSSLAVTSFVGGIDQKKINKIIKDIIEIIDDNKSKIIIVSSGAINAGKNYLTKFNRSEMKSMQASSAIGQPILMEAFQKAFKKYKKICAQVLLTHDDFKNKERALNIRSSLSYLLENEIIPIVNENDSVSYDEISLGDNDQLSAMLCEMMGANLLCMLTKVDGLYDRDPNIKGANKFDTIQFDEDFSKVKMFSKTVTGRGGMKTKLEAVRKLTPLGINVVIGSFECERPVLKAITRKSGTWFYGQKNIFKSKKGWILTRVRTGAIIKIDNGAQLAILENHSLLPIGINKVEGKFGRGDCVTIMFQKKIIGFGVSEYSAKEIELIKDCKSSEIGSVLKHTPSKVVIHKNNLILKERL